jgi:hypothetical protein
MDSRLDLYVVLAVIVAIPIGIATIVPQRYAHGGDANSTMTSGANNTAANATATSSNVTGKISAYGMPTVDEELDAQTKLPDQTEQSRCVGCMTGAFCIPC